MFDFFAEEIEDQGLPHNGEPVGIGVCISFSELGQIGVSIGFGVVVASALNNIEDLSHFVFAFHGEQGIEEEQKSIFSGECIFGVGAIVAHFVAAVGRKSFAEVMEQRLAAAGAGFGEGNDFLE